jgi:drug/metabolite transporter, DME family
MPVPAECNVTSRSATSDVDVSTKVTPVPPSPKTESLASSSVEAVSVTGLLLGLLAAVCYSVTNIGLKQLSGTQDGLAWDFWICGVKALPTVLLSSWMMLQCHRAGQNIVPPKNMLWMILGMAVVMQAGGNLGFQLALRSVGLAISVPVVFASILCSGAVAGRIVLGDPVERRTGISMAFMVVSIVFLSAGARSAAGASDGASPFALTVLAGILFATVSGVGYGLGGVVIRRSVKAQVPVPVILFLFSSVGVLAFCPLGGIPLGAAGLQNISTIDWMLLLGSGLFNAFGFFAITHALRLLTINKANVVNAAQNAMCAVAGFALFAEPITAMTLTGIALTITGLLILGRR